MWSGGRWFGCPIRSQRPIVVPDTARVTVSLLEDHPDVYLSLDGQVGFPLRAHVEVEIRRSPHVVRSVRDPNLSFCELLRRKLGWGEGSRGGRNCGTRGIMRSTLTACISVKHSTGRRSPVIRSYLDHALRRARYTQLDDGTFCAEVRGLRGVIATGSSVETCRAELESVIEGWILIRVAKGLPIPSLDGARIRVPKAS